MSSPCMGVFPEFQPTAGTTGRAPCVLMWRRSLMERTLYTLALFATLYAAVVLMRLTG